MTHGSLPALLAVFAGAASTLGWYLATAGRDGVNDGLRRFLVLGSDTADEE